MSYDSKDEIWTDVRKLKDAVAQHTINWEFWRMALHTLQEEKHVYRYTIGDRLDYWNQRRYILLRIRNNHREIQALTARIGELQNHPRITGQWEGHVGDWG